jgi:hypothetical protein
MVKKLNFEKEIQVFPTIFYSEIIKANILSFIGLCYQTAVNFYIFFKIRFKVVHLTTKNLHKK